MERQDHCGLLNLNKPTGETSRDAVNRVVRLVGKTTKVGHAGTLDPLASGVLVLCVGAATRLIEYVQRLGKVYRTTIRLGARSATLDADGLIVPTPDSLIPTEARVRAVLATQVGTIAQVPPRFSALKVEGRRAYDLARAGHDVELAARPVTIDRIDVRSYAWPLLELEIACGGGTYIRAIARDVGEALGCGGLVEVLVRTRIGPFALADAVDPRDLTAEAVRAHLRPAADALVGLPRVRLTAEQVALVARGQPLDVRRVGPGLAPTAAGEVALLGPDGVLVAVAEWIPRSGRLRPRRVLAAGPSIG